MKHDPRSLDVISPDDFRRIREVFESALERSTAARASFVEHACEGDLVLINEVERMLAADARAHPLLDGGVELSADPLPAGTVFAKDFCIGERLGRGGMGEVYRAHDGRLDRDVALKFLPREFSLDADRTARFKREAHVLGSLNHPNIAAIYGFEASDDLHALVLELVEGPTLADRIALGPIPVDEAVPIARQVAEALEAAHEQGIIHRDLKPANIKVRSDGTVKVLDFGLAKVTRPQSGGSGDVAVSPAITSLSMAQRGVILGSAAYVSPEQARGREADKRSDVWAFGVVLYEMLSGRRAFQGEEIQDTLASVLRQDIDFAALPASTPETVRHLIARCLGRDVRQRLRDIGEARIVLEHPESLRADVESAHRSRRRHAMSIAVAIAGGVLGAALMWSLQPTPRPAITRLAFAVPEAAALLTNRGVVTISPDGTRVVYASPSGLYLRWLSAFDAQLIRGSEGIFNLTEPTFSPDGQSIVFHTSADQTLKRIPVAGGTAVTIAHAMYPYGVSWGPNGIVFVQPVGPTRDEPRRSRIMRVSAEGGTPEVLIPLNDGEVAHGPQLLPGGKQLLFTLSTRTTPDRWDTASIVVQTVASGERKTLIEGGSDARFVPTGHLIYAVRGTLLAVAFDVNHLEVTSAPVAVVEGIRRADASSTGGAHYSFANNGTLAYIAGPLSPGLDIALTDRKGGVERLRMPLQLYEAPRVSPDGTRIAVGTDDGREAVIWMYRLSGASAIQRITFGGNNRFPVWSSDGRRIAFQSDREGDKGIFWQPADGAGTAERLTTSGPDESHEPEAWSPSADVLLFSITKGADITLWTLSLKDRKATPFGDVHSSTRIGAVFSPDGRWVAYARSERGQKSIYVQPFPPTGIKYQIPANESEQPNHPLWSPDGSELFYNPGPGDFESVIVSTHPTFVFGKSTALVRPFRGASTLTRRPYDLTPDGRFVVAIADGPFAASTHPAQEIRVVLNWFSELRTRVPRTK